VIRSILSSTHLYAFYQRLVGGIHARKKTVEEYIPIKENIRILDIGCGPGYIVTEFVNCDYFGYDVNSSYIQYAKKKYGERGTFVCKELKTEDIEVMEHFDLVMLHGVLHHINDDAVENLFILAKRILHKDGYVLTQDGCIIDGQSYFDKMLQKNDRGEFVRRPEEYEKLAGKVFENVQVDIRDDLFYVPYTAVVMKCF